MRPLAEFCEYMVESATKANQHFTAETYADLNARFGHMKNDVAHSHLLKLHRELTEVMNNTTTSIDPEHGVAWTQRCDVEQAIRWMEGEINLK
jgi:hypothetical protein